MDSAGSATAWSPDAQREFRVWGQMRKFCALQPKHLKSLLLDAFNDWQAHNAGRLGAALSYYTLFSIAPILVVTVGIVGLVYGPTAAQGQLSPWLERLLGYQGAQAAQFLLSRASSISGGVLATTLGVLSLVLGASSVVNELRNSLNIVWKIDDCSNASTQQGVSMWQAIRDMFTARLYAFAIVLGAGALIILTMAATTIVAAAGKYVQVMPVPEIGLQAFNFLLGLGLMTAMFAIVYKMLPDAYVAWGDAATGGLVTALLFNLGGILLSTFVGKTAGSVYGTAGSVIALLLWVYYSAQVFLFGAELTRIFANQYGGGIIPHRRSWPHVWPPR